MTTHNMSFLTIVILLGAALAGCTSPGAGDGAGGETTHIQQAGSSTVLPIAEAWAEEFEAAHRDVRFSVKGGGSGAGFEKFCRGETQISDASRPIKDNEVAACNENGIDPFEITVAVDGLAVVVSRDNEFVDSLTVEELNRMWTSDESKQANLWSDLRPEWPEEEISLFGPGTDSGTYDYWVETIIEEFDGDGATTRSDYTPSEDDNVLVQGVANSDHGLGYFGLAYAVENQDKLRMVPIDNGEGPVLPTEENVESGEYAPLSRPIFMYTDGKPEGILQTYFEFGMSDEGQELVTAVGYVALPQATRQKVLDSIQG